MSSFKDLVKKANAGKQTTKKKEEDKKHSSFVDLVKKTNANIKSNLTEEEVSKWSNSVGDIGKRAFNYLATDGYKKADTALAEEINKHIEDSHSISQYLRANKSKFKNYEDIYNGYVEQVNYLKDLQKSITDSNEYFSKFKTEKEYEDHKIGWLNPEAETNAETASARQERYRQNEARLKQMEEDLPWYAATIMPDFMENWFMSDEDEKKKVEYETLKAENNQYKRTQSVIDEYYTPETPEFLANGAERNYTNVSKEDLQKHNASQTYIESLLSDGNHYYDSNGNIVNATTKKIDYVADDLTRAMYAEATGSPTNGGFFDIDASDNYVDQFYNNLVQDKLGMFLSASEDDLATAYSELASAPTDVKNTWARVLQEGDQNAWKQLEEHELNIYYNLYKTQGQAAAYEYLDKMTTELTRRETVARQKEIDEASWLEQLWLNAKSVPQNVFGGALSFVEDAANVVRGEDINPYSRAHSFQNDAQYVRQVTAQAIDEATGGAAIPWIDFSFGDAYQALMSAADSTVGAMMGGGTYGTLMGMGAASSTMKDLWEKGADAGQMFAGGILSGAAEMIFEKYSIDNLVKIGDSKTIGQFIFNGLKQGGVEASEEMLTEIANTITNSIVMGSQSDWVDTETFVKSVLNSGLSGFMSGGTMGGTVSAINYTVNKSKFKQAGADIIEQGATEELLKLANEMAGVTGDKTLSKYSAKAIKSNQTKVGSKKTALEIGRTASLLQDNITKQNRGEIQDALIEKGLDKKDAKRVSEYLISTDELTEKQREEVRSNEEIKAVAKALLGDPESSINERQKKYIAAKLGVEYKPSNLSNTATDSGDIAVNTEVNVKDKVSADGKTVQVSTGEAITINKDNAIAKIKTVDGERVVYLNTDKGVVASNDVNYANESEALVYESFVDLNPAFANAVIKNYDGKVPVQTYIKGMREGIVLYGMHNFQGVDKDISKDTFFAELSAEDQAFALKLGSAYADMVAKKQGKTLRTAIKNAAEKAEANNNTSAKAKPQKGSVRFEDGVAAKGKLQKRTVRLAKHLAKAIGIDIVFYDSRTTNDANVKDADGNLANGYYDVNNDTIHLDMQNAKNDAKTIIFTLSHELVHFIKKWSPEKFNTLAKFLMENYAKHGVKTDKLLANKMVELGTKDADLAYEEMIADACETMLLDSNAVYKLMELRKADLELFEKIKLHIHELLNKLRNMYKELGYSPRSVEANELFKMTDVIKQIHSLFEEASVDAAQNYQAASETDIDKQSEDIKKQAKQDVSKKGLSYNSLISLPDLVGSTLEVSNQVQITADGKIDDEWLCKKVFEQCESVQTNAPLPTYYLYSGSLGKNIEITKKSIQHGYIASRAKNKPASPKEIENARATLNLHDILKTAIVVNISEKYKNNDTPFAYVMMGVTRMNDPIKGDGYYAVRMIVQERKNGDPILQEANVLGRLSAVNAKKIDLPNPQVGSKEAVALKSGGQFGYSIADLIKDVKDIFPDTFSTDVYDHFKMQRVDNKTLSPLRFQKKQVSNRTILSNALETTIDTSTQAGQNELKMLKQYQDKIASIEEQETRLAELNAEIKELSFGKGTDRSKLNELKLEKVKTNNRLNILDKQLMRIEAMKPIKDILEREKEKVRKRTEEKGKQALAEYRKEALKVQKQMIGDAKKETRDKISESRQKAELKAKIKKVVSELNKLLLNGTKDKHVTEDLQKAVAMALDAFNMDTVGADKRVAKYNALIAKATDPDVIAALTETRDRIQKQGDRMSDKLTKLKDAYANIIQSSDANFANAYDKVIVNYIEAALEKVKNTSLRDMSIDQLDTVYSVYKMVLTTVRNFNKAFKMAKDASISNISHKVMTEVKKVGGVKTHFLGGKLGSALSWVKKFDFNNLKPVYAFERIGSNTLSKVFENVRKGEDVWAVDVTEAKDFKEKTTKKYNYKKWDFDKVYSFKTSTGNEFSLSLEQIMSLYAYSKREQALPHLAEGGFVFDGNIEVHKETVEEAKDGNKTKRSFFKYKVNTADAHKISALEVADIVGKLSAEQKAFVDEMQAYLSDVMGAKGNEVSLEMYGIKLFKEQHYFPLKSAKQYMFEQNDVAGEVKIKNSGFSQGTVKHANNPVILSNFMDVWANHVNDMSMYHAFVLPLEDFNRVFNYNTPASESVDEVSVKGTIQNAYGSMANEYISQLIKDLNGGARVDPRESTSKNMIGKFKKAAVLGSASVVIQQPSAVARALAVINARYFDFNPKFINHNKLWAETKKYAPVAIIKEMGRFDTDMGASTVDYIKGEKTIMNYVDDGLSWGASMMDELTWVHIWAAVKREVKANHKDLSGEAYLKKCGERFTEVITKTQVYDSVLSRSANMRSKSVWMNMLTSFMAEPTTAINMVMDSMHKIARGQKGIAARQMVAVAASVILNSLLVSLIYAARDDDEDETFLEKYIGSFTAEIIDGANPITYFPIVKDIWSIAQGFDVERSDMTLISKAFESLKNVTSVMMTDTEDMSEEELAEHKKEIANAWLSVSGELSSLFGIPAKNLIREIKAGFNFHSTLNNGAKDSWSLFWDSVVNSAKNTVPVVGWFDKETKSDKFYKAKVNGDTAMVDRLKSGYKDDKAYNSAIRKGLRDNEPRIKEAAEARFSGDMTLYDDIVYQIKNEGYFDQDNIVAAITTEYNKLKSATEEKSSESSSPDTFNYSDYYNAIINGDANDVAVVKEYLIEDGKTEKNIESNFNSHVKDAYEKGELDEYKAKSLMVSYGGKSEDEADILIRYVDFKNDYPEYKDTITESRFENYYEPMEDYYGRSVATTGLSFSCYSEYCVKSAECTGTDADGDGKADSGTKKAEIIKVINTLPITIAQKDALYFLNGWSKKKLFKDAPWR